ncbi:elongation of very long chain fatty acids protein AAEL008004-like [Anastrepha ludens]|uniref:elongation of very long chain fatty acids protein AAEL008004-like n=1 Tax=Anastrepha ludens TaxID=28586 RepID=UPI0023B17516|nr:elongation of very long chain fatty acids protein AAEL008004-like [Anastrepha ludens]
MFLILRLIYKEMRKADAAFNRDLRISSWPLLGPPWSMFAIIAIYLFIVKLWGPKLMESRRPFNVMPIIRIHNLIQVALNVYIFTASFSRSYLKPYFSLSCQRYDPKDTSPEMMALVIPAYLYYISKYMDLLDTIFFLLRKNYRQISFLHVYHHSLMVFAVWVYCTLNFASHFTFTGVINSFIHICMYSYYFLATLKLKTDITTWKRTLTLLQILQFLSLTIQLSLPILNNWCGLDLFWVWVAFLQNFFILALFCDFYYKTYMRKVHGNKKVQKQQKRKQEFEVNCGGISSGSSTLKDAKVH